MDSQLMGYVIGAICGGIFLLALAAGGGYMIYFSLNSRKKAAASQSWPSADGVITSADVHHSTSTDSDGDTTHSYTPAITYDYDVLGQVHHGNRVAFGGTTGYGNPAKAQQALEAFPVGSRVTVYYNPENPDEAVLEQKARATTGLMIGGIVMVVVALCLGCVGVSAAIYNLFK